MAGDRFVVQERLLVNTISLSVDSPVIKIPSLEELLLFIIQLLTGHKVLFADQIPYFKQLKMRQKIELKLPPCATLFLEECS